MGRRFRNHSFCYHWYVTLSDFIEIRTTGGVFRFKVLESHLFSPFRGLRNFHLLSSLFHLYHVEPFLDLIRLFDPLSQRLEILRYPLLVIPLLLGQFGLHIPLLLFRLLLLKQVLLNLKVSLLL